MKTKMMINRIEIDDIKKAHKRLDDTIKIHMNKKPIRPYIRCENELSGIKIIFTFLIGGFIIIGVIVAVCLFV